MTAFVVQYEWIPLYVRMFTLELGIADFDWRGKDCTGTIDGRLTTATLGILVMQMIVVCRDGQGKRD